LDKQDRTNAELGSTESELLRKLRPNKIMIPIAFGLGVVAWMLYREWNPEAFRAIDLGLAASLWFAVGMALMVLRDLGYMMRLRVLSEGQFSWRQSFRIIMLWEFTSAVTPSVVGGTALAVLFMNKEGMTLGRSTAITLATSVLDELYFITMFPILLLVVSPQELFAVEGNAGGLGFANEFFYFAVVGYSIKVLYTLFIAYGLFMNPRGVKWLLVRVCSVRWLRKWRHAMVKVGDDLIVSSIELKRKPFSFWLKAYMASFLSWTSRYWVVNSMLIAFFGLHFHGLGQHFLIFARQLVMWLMMLVSPTPGGSGFAEFVFAQFLGEFIPVAGVVVALALIWRLATYYPYLFIGAFLVPRWVRSKFGAQSAFDKDSA